MVLPCLLLAGCGGGGNGGVASTPAPTPSPTPTPGPTPTPSSYDTAEFRRSTGPQQHGVLTAYDAGASGAGITVGIVDSGIARTNSEFAGRISSASQDFAGNGSIEDEDGHGTAVATVLAGARDNSFVMGMAWGATILALRTDTPGSCSGADDGEDGCSHGTNAIARALDHARLNGARVVNISLGGEDPAPSNLLAAIDRATAAGVIIVIAAGNEGNAAPDAFASSFADAAVGRGLVIIAGSVSASGVRSSFSNGAQGQEASTLFARGEDILSQDNQGAHFLYGGTSFATPQIAGAAALLAQAFPSLSSAQIVALLLGRATDAGASGADAVYGRGILNIAAAFAPAGSTTLAGSAVPVSTARNATLSPAMGDAGSAGDSGAVMIDRLGRAYRLNLGATLGIAAPDLRLAPALIARRQAVALSVGPARLSLDIARQPVAIDGIAGLALPAQEQARPRPMSGSISLSPMAGTRLRFGFSQRADLPGPDGTSSGQWLVAGNAGSHIGFVRRGTDSLSIAQRLGNSVTLITGFERGRVAPAHGEQEQARADRYTLSSMGVATRLGAIGLYGGIGLLDEGATVLGARFGDAIGARSGRTLFLDARLDATPGPGWALGLTMRQGWTRAADLRLRSSAWSLDASRGGLALPMDRLSLRLSQPLRVDAGGLTLWLPVAYDYATGAVAMDRRLLSLAPQGREVDAEADYGLPAAGGWLDLNLFLRRQPGHVAAMPPDRGAALRYALRF